MSEEDKFGRLIAELTPDNLIDLLQYARVLLAHQQTHRDGPTAQQWAQMPEATRREIVLMVSQSIVNQSQ
ncbi:MAG: hypothetical protein HYZ25_06250 [Chloroflexi bacterium]|nr:hypothetical protein [Chloroflexota bacterium]